MIKLGRFKFKKNILISLRENFSQITLGILLLGYISFYTYSAKYSLPYISPSISFIAGLGIFCMLIVLLIYFIAKYKSIYRSVRVLILMFILSILSANTLIIFATIYSLNLNSNLLNFRKHKFSKSKKIYQKFRRKEKTVLIISLIILLIVAIFLSYKAMIVFVFLDTCIVEFQIAIYYKARFLNLFIIIILIPIFVFGYFIENSNYTIFGMSQKDIKILNKDSTVIEGKLVYRDENNLYIMDTAITRSSSYLFSSSYNCTAINLDEIKSYHTVTKNPKSTSKESFIELFKQIK